MHSTQKFSVQLITESELLKDALRFRNKTKKPTNQNIQENADHHFESDAFDRRSLHIGLFYNNGVKKELAGYCRMIFPKFVTCDYLNFLIDNAPDFIKRPKFHSSEKLACIENLNIEDTALINSFCLSLEKEEIVYTETSHFIVDAKHCTQKTCSFFVSNLFAICNSLSIDYNFISCYPQDVLFYSNCGLILFAGIKLLGKDVSGQNLFVFGTNLKLANADKPKANLLKAKTDARGIKWSGLEIPEKLHHI